LLVDQSLLRQAAGIDGAPRFVMLETIHEYALERLHEQGELAMARQRHAGWYLGLALEAEPALTGPRQRLWLNRLEQDHGNLRAAIQWALDREDAATALKFCEALWKFWQFHNHYSLGMRLIEAALALRGAGRSPLRAKVLCGAGWLAFSQGDEARAQRWFADSLAIGRKRRDRAGTAMALHGVGQIAQLRGDYTAARASYEESLELFRALGNSEEIAWSLHHLGKLAREQGDCARSAALMQECLSIFQQVGHTWGITLALRHLGYIAHMQGDVAKATAYYQEALSLLREVGDRASCVWTLVYLAEAALLQGDDPRAAAYFRESLALAEDVGDSQAIGWCLVGLARLATARLSSEQAAVFFGAAEALLDTLGARMSVSDRAEWDEHIAAVRNRLDQATFAAAWAKGRAMTIEQTTEFEAAAADRRPLAASRALPSPP
jgi:tetratricopeptide (TPR) repeat protein